MNQKRTYWLFLFYIFRAITYAQDTTGVSNVFVEYEGRKINTHLIHDPARLETVLTKNKTTDEDKFAAIFKWVVHNIDYRRGDYVSTGELLRPDIKKLLKTRHGVCEHYAALMDTLCKLADLASAVVYGYAKNEFFDLGDSVYCDNHAWNAVKLNNYWYIYDVTFASGTPYYRYTKFSQFIFDTKNRFAVGYKAVTIRKKKAFFFAEDCAQNDTLKPVIRYELVVKRKWLYRLLSLFKLKVIRDYKKKIDTSYYLASPEFMAIEHIPDNPAWTLLSSLSVRHFETDSAFYYLSSGRYKKQQLSGSTCVDCDNELYMTNPAQSFYFRKQSLNFNKRNRYIPSRCEYIISRCKFEDSKKTEDSLTKVTLIDSALAFLNSARENVVQAYLNERMEYATRKNKNRQKMYALVDDNHQRFGLLKERYKTTLQETNNIRDLADEMNIYAKKLYRRKRVVKEYRTGREIEKSSRKVVSAIMILKVKQAILNSQTDSLNAIINTERMEFSKGLQPLVEILWKNATTYDTLIRLAGKCENYRMHILDNYKREIVELRAIVRRFEEQLGKAMDSVLYRAGLICNKRGNRILKLVDERNTIRLENYKIKTQLLKFRELESKDLDEYKQQLLDENQDDFCWLRGQPGYLRSVFYGFKVLLSKQQRLMRKLSDEIKAEAFRYAVIDFELYRKKRRSERIFSYDRSVINCNARMVRKNKSQYLRSLRDALNEARRNK